jgi:hypothetical protein
MTRNGFIAPGIIGLVFIGSIIVAKLAEKHYMADVKPIELVKK